MIGLHIFQRTVQLKLRWLVPVGGTLLVVFSLLTATAARHFVVLPQLLELQAQADRKDLRRVLLAIDGKKLQLATLAYQSAIDDRTYNLLQKPSLHTLENNTPDYTLSNFHIDIVALFDRDNRLAAQRIAREPDTLFRGDELPITDLLPLLIDLRKVEERAPLFNTGFALTADGPVLYAVASVMHSDTSGTSNGNFFLATGFDRELQREIEESSQLKVSFSKPDATDLLASPQSADSIHRDTKNRIFWLIRNEEAQPILKLTLSLTPSNYDKELLLPVQVSFLTNLISFCLLMLVFRKMLIKPILALSRHLRRVRAEGDYSLRLNYPASNEIGDLSRDIDALVQHVQVQQDQLHAQTAEMQALSFQDGLTGLANRRRFDQALADNWALAQRARSPLALIMFDVDYFKKYNDHYGHQLGDEALKRLAAIVRQVVVRQSDLAARYGGEEFAILLPETAESGAEQIAVRLQEEIHKAAILHQKSSIDRLLTISVGVAALVPDNSNSPRDLVHAADIAMYNAKASGRNCIVLASRSAT